MPSQDSQGRMLLHIVSIVANLPITEVEGHYPFSRSTPVRKCWSWWVGIRMPFQAILRKPLARAISNWPPPRSCKRPPATLSVRSRHVIGSHRSFGPSWMPPWCTRTSWGRAPGSGPGNLHDSDPSRASESRHRCQPHRCCTACLAGMTPPHAQPAMAKVTAG